MALILFIGVFVALALILLLFVLLDGWARLIHGLVLTYV